MFVLFYVFLCCLIHCLFCDFLCIVCVYMRTELLPPGGYPVAVIYIISYDIIFFLWRCDPLRVMASSFLRFLDHTRRRSTVGRTFLYEWSTRRRGLYLTTHNTHNKHPCPGGIRTHDLSRRAAADLRLRPRGHWDRHHIIYRIISYHISYHIIRNFMKIGVVGAELLNAGGRTDGRTWS